MTKEQDRGYYQFSAFRIDVRERLLFNQRGVVPLTPKAFDTLLILVENSRHVLTKEELMQRIWPDSFVEENNLAQNISLLRRVLSEEGGGTKEKFIETVPKRGYRFLADVTECFEETGGRAASAPDTEMHARCDEPERRKGKPSLRDVVIIGRAVNFK